MKIAIALSFVVLALKVNSQDTDPVIQTYDEFAPVGAALPPFYEGQSDRFVPLENSATTQVDCPPDRANLPTEFYTEYIAYLKQHGKAYVCDDFYKRYSLFIQRRREITAFNQRTDVTYTQAVNFFTDLSDDERNLRLGVPQVDSDNLDTGATDRVEDAAADLDFENLTASQRQDDFSVNIASLPIFQQSLLSFDFMCCFINPFGVPCFKDWQSLGKVTSVKNQGGCGSCWAFAAIAALESARLIAGGASLNLSEQEIVSCATAAWGNSGCSGGWPHKALDYIIKNRVYQEITVPYTATNGVCTSPFAWKQSLSLRTVILPQNRMDTFLQALNKKPIAIAFKATGGFFSYSSGIYNPIFDAACSTPGINHAVLAVGWGLGCKPFIKFRNSWGTGWGDAGYFKMKISKNIIQNGPCNLINHPYNVYPTL